MLKTILAISGRPGLYKLLSRSTRMLIVESVDEQKKRQPVHASERVVSLSDISIYTDDDKEVPLQTVFRNIQEAYAHQAVELSPKKSASSDIQDFFRKALPNYDADRVHLSDMRKVLAWYNLLVKAQLDDFEPEEETSAGEEEKAETPEKTA